MDPTTQTVLTILGIGGHVTKDAVTDIVKRMFGPMADHLGESLRDYFVRRADRAEQIVTDSANMLADAGIGPRAVPHRILVPILENASWEDDPDLQRHWSALLANAATPGKEKDVIPAFAEILRQCTSTHARLVKFMYEMETDSYIGFSTWPHVPREKFVAEFPDVAPADYALLMSDLERLQVVEPRRDLKALFPDYEDTADAGELVRLVVHVWNSPQRYEVVGLTTLGVRFMMACTPPKAVTAAE